MEEKGKAVRKREKKIPRSDGVKIKQKVDAMGNIAFGSGAQDQRTNPRIKEKLRAALVAGNTYVAASRLAGISISTFTRWMSQGREAKEGTLAREFFDFVELASTEAEHRNVMCIQKAAGGGSWQAAAWWLERRRPTAYARKDTLNIGNDNGPFEVSVSEAGALNDEEKKAALRAVLARNPDIYDSISRD